MYNTHMRLQEWSLLCIIEKDIIFGDNIFRRIEISLFHTISYCKEDSVDTFEYYLPYALYRIYCPVHTLPYIHYRTYSTVHTLQYIVNLTLDDS